MNLRTSLSVLLASASLAGCVMEASDPSELTEDELASTEAELQSRDVGRIGGIDIDLDLDPEPFPGDPTPIGSNPCPECGFVFRGGSASTPWNTYRLFVKLRWPLLQAGIERIELVYQTEGTNTWTVMGAVKLAGGVPQTAAQFVYPTQSVPEATRDARSVTYALRYVPVPGSYLRLFTLPEIYETASAPYSPEGATPYEPPPAIIRVWF